MQRSLSFNLPLAGAVSLPWVFDWSGAQLGLVNINLGLSADPDIEQRILDDVGSYGRQLGRIGDALEVLLDRLVPAKPSEPQREAIDAFREQLRVIRRIKDRVSSAPERTPR